MDAAPQRDVKALAAMFEKKTDKPPPVKRGASKATQPKPQSKPVE
jgi:hypothetical protein